MWCNVANARIANSLSNFLQQPATTPRSEGLTRNKRSAFHTFFRFHYFNWPRNEGRHCSGARCQHQNCNKAYLEVKLCNSRELLLRENYSNSDVPGLGATESLDSVKH
uniref:Uncharacterized protein n=1 Tax=Physcomitrium patens TaxID=3218 RepID=A0A2K1KKH4_PHYPA|nr:hypothetical protein PHYPA_007949 [Physcomitrium patens]